MMDSYIKGEDKAEWKPTLKKFKNHLLTLDWSPRDPFPKHLQSFFSDPEPSATVLTTMKTNPHCHELASKLLGIANRSHQPAAVRSRLVRLITRYRPVYRTTHQMVRPGWLSSARKAPIKTVADESANFQSDEVPLHEEAEGGKSPTAFSDHGRSMASHPNTMPRTSSSSNTSGEVSINRLVTISSNGSFKEEGSKGTPDIELGDLLSVLNLSNVTPSTVPTGQSSMNKGDEQ
jgi:hypothetical protein